ncbi:protein-disulfide reductase [Malassezia pachydermatis]
MFVSMWGRLAACIVLVSTTLVHAALFPKNSPVLELTSANFDKEILQVDKPALVAFTAPWCGYCQNLAPQYARVAGELDGVVKIAYVDCEDKASASLCGKYDVKGFPTIKLFPATKKRVPRDYVGERRAKAIMDYALDALPAEIIRKLDAEGLPPFLSKSSGPAKLVLVSQLGKTSPMFRSLALDYRHAKIPFAHMYAGKEGSLAAAQKHIDEHLTKERLPGLYFVKSYDEATGKAQAIKYRGSMRYRQIKQWIDEQLGDKEALKAKAEREKAKAAMEQKETEKQRKREEAAAKAKEAASKSKMESGTDAHDKGDLPPGITSEQWDMAHKIGEMIGDDEVEEEEEREQKRMRELNKKRVEALKRAREKVSKDAGVDTPPSTPQTKEMLMNELQDHIGEKWSVRLAEHADQARQAIEKHLLEDPEDIKTAMNAGEEGMIRGLQKDLGEIETQLEAGADEDGYPLSEDAEEALRSYSQTIAGLIHTIQLRLDARRLNRDARELADEMLGQHMHDEL